jgi:hypothetical protein
MNEEVMNFHKFRPRFEDYTPQQQASNGNAVGEFFPTGMSQEFVPANNSF